MTSRSFSRHVSNGFIWALVASACALSLSAQPNQRIEIPNTAGATLTLPAGWRSGPGSDGAVLMLQAPDGNAQVMVNLVPLNPGMAMDQFRDLMADSTRDQVLNAGLPVNAPTAQNVQLGDRLFRVDSFPINDPAQPLLLEFAYTGEGNQLLVFNISAAQNAPQRVAEARQAVQSLTRTTQTQVAAQSTPPPRSNPGAIDAFGGNSTIPPTGPPTSNVAAADDNALRRLEADLLQRLQAQGAYTPWVNELATIRTRLAESHAARHEWDPAVAYLSSAVQLDPTHADRFELLGDLLDNIAAPAAPFLAQSYYEDSLELAPDNRTCRLKLAASYQATDELRDALAHYEILARNEGGTPDPAVVQDLCLSYLGAGEEKRGAVFLEEIVMAGAPAEFCLAWAIMKDACGDPAEAARLAHYTASVATNAPLQSYAQKLALGFENKGGLR